MDTPPLRAFALALLVSFSSLAFASSVRAQDGEVTGRVVDAGTQAPLPGANVLLVAPESGDQIAGAATDVQGRYALTGISGGSYELVVRFVGYRTSTTSVEVGAGAAITVEVALEAAGIDLSQVIVSASRTQEMALDAPASISVLDAEEIEQTVSPSSVEGLRTVTGVDVAQTGVDRRELALRGFNNAFSGATYVLTDYRQAAVPSLGVNIYSIMPNMSLDVDRVEIVRGPGSALYGAGVDAGVIHFLTKSPFDHPGTTVSLTGGQRSMMAGQLRHADVVGERFGYKITGSYAEGTDWKLDPSDPVDRVQLEIDGRARNPDYQRYNVNAMAQYRFADEVQLTLNGGHSALTAAVLSGIGTVQGDGFGYSYGQVRFRAGDFFAQGYLNKNDAGDSFVYGSGLPVVDRGELWAFQTQYERDYWSGRQRFVVGGDAELTRPKTEGQILGRNEDDDDITEVGAYLQSVTELSDRVELTAALRADHNNIVETVQWSPRAALVFKPVPTHSIRGSYNRAFSSPGTNSNFLDIVARRPDEVLPVPIRARGSGRGFTFERNPAYGAFAPTDLVASSLSPSALGADQPVGLGLGAVYGSVYAGLSQIPPEQLAAMMQSQGVQVSPEEAAQIVQLLAPGQTVVQGFSSGVLALLNPSATTAAERFQPIGYGDVTDIPPLEQRTSQTFEVGYKGLLGDRFMLAADGYYTIARNFISPLRMETPMVFVPELSGDLTGALAGGIDQNAQLEQALRDKGVSPEQAAALIVGLAGGDLPGAQTPVAVVQPVENNPGVGEMPELMLAYRNFGEVKFWGIDLGMEWLLSDTWSVFANTSIVSDDFFDHTELDTEEADLSLALNAPSFKARGGWSYRQEQGLSLNMAGRYVEGFPVRSGPYVGEIDDYFVLDVGAGYDLSGWAPGLRLDATVHNVLGNAHREFIGAPEMDRIGYVRLTYAIR